MKVLSDPAKDTTVESESSDFYEQCGVRSTSPFSKQIFSPSSSSSDGELTEIDDSDSDNNSDRDSDSDRIFKIVAHETLDHIDTVTPKTSCGTKEIHATEPGTSETYDRESILYELAHPENFGVIRKLERMQGSSKTGKFTELFGNSGSKDSERTAEEWRKLLTKRLGETLQAVPDTLLHILTGRIRPGDCGRPVDQKPDWLDMDKLRRGQKFAQDHIFSLFFSEMLTFSALYSFEDSLKPLIMTEKSSTPYTAFRRYLSVGLRFRHWYTQDPWTKGTDAWKDILVVRAMHAAVRRKLDTSTNEEIDDRSIISDPWCTMREILLKDFSESCEAPVIGQCPYMAERNSDDRPKGINQTEMALTQWNSVGLITSYPKSVGLHDVTDEDLEAYCHLWRSIGYQLGIEDEFNYCRGTLAEIRQRNRDFVETWVKPNLREITPEWEHMLRCIFAGTSVILPGLTFEVALFYLAEILDLRMPRLYASLSYTDWITHNIIKYLIHHGIKLPGIYALVNTVLNRALDRAKNFTPEKLEAIQIKLSDCTSRCYKKLVATDDRYGDR